MELTVPQIEDIGMTYGRLRESGAAIADCVAEAVSKLRGYRPDMDKRTAEHVVRVIITDSIGEL